MRNGSADRPGGHNDVKRELSGVFHAVTGAHGRFKTGQMLARVVEGLDVSNTLLEGMGVADRLVPTPLPMAAVDAIRA